jgi:integrase
VRWFGSNGKRYSKSFKTRKEAERYAEIKQLEARDGKADPPEVLKLKDFARMYIEIRGDLKESSLYEHRRTLRYLKEHFGPDRMIGCIKPLDARKFISWFRKRKIKERPLAPGTTNKLIRECRRIFREAVDCELIDRNPFAGIRQEKVGQVEWHYVSPAEYKRLVLACPSLRWRGIITVAYFCGQRRDEILNLTWSDIDFEKGRLRVVRKRASVDKVEWTPKDKDMRIIPLSTEVLAVLAELHNAAEEGQVYVFVSSKGPARGSRLKKNNIWRDFKAIRVKAGLPRFSLHDMRKSYCTNMAEVLPMHVVQELAGHSDIRTTRQYYLRVNPKFVEDVRRAMEAITQT